jgi:phosphatidylglycerol---prolipoprotein diacylglyceryl transferase
MHPILVEFGPITIRYYGLMYVIAIGVGLFILHSEVKRKKLTSRLTGEILSLDDLLDLLLWAVPAAIIGARIYYVAFQWQYYGSHPLDMLKIWQGGLAIHGGVIGGIIAVYLFSHRRKISFWALTDAISLSLILGQAIGRIGNLMNGDAYGVPTQLPWGIRFPASSPAGIAYPGQATHPSMIYEMILNLLIFALLWQLRKRDYKDGFITSMYFILYSVARSIVSFTRGDSLWLGSIRAAHLISAVLIVLFSLLIFSRRLYRKTKPETFPPSRSAEQEDHR